MISSKQEKRITDLINSPTIRHRAFDLVTGYQNFKTFYFNLIRQQQDPATADELLSAINREPKYASTDPDKILDMMLRAEAELLSADLIRISRSKKHGRIGLVQVV